MVDRAALSAEITAASHALHARGWVANHDGNVSTRFDGGFLVTPTAVSKAAVQAAALARLDAAGAWVDGPKAPSEVALHLAAYAARDDVQAVVHAHPPYATALACAGVALDVFLPEAVVSLGARVPLTDFALPFGDEGAAPVRALIDRYDALLLDRHGVLTVGPCVELAMLRMELVEHLARIWTLAAPAGGVRALPEGVLSPLLARRRAAAGSLGAAAARAGLAADDAGDAAPATPSAPSSWTPAPSLAAAGAPTAPASTAWTPAGPPPAADAWSGGKTGGACGQVFGAGDLRATVAAEIKRHLG